MVDAIKMPKHKTESLSNVHVVLTWHFHQVKQSERHVNKPGMKEDPTIS